MPDDSHLNLSFTFREDGGGVTLLASTAFGRGHETWAAADIAELEGIAADHAAVCQHRVAREANRRAPDTSGWGDLCRVGNRLAALLLRGRVRRIYDETRGRALAMGHEGVRLLFAIDPDDETTVRLGRVPWEVLDDREGEGPLALHRSTPVVRHLALSTIPALTPLPYPLRLAIAFADPRRDLSVEDESARIRRAWRNLDGVELDFLRASEPDELRARLLELRPHVLHFIGHGANDGSGSCLLLEKAPGRELRLDAKDAARVLAVPGLRAAVLNACHSGSLGSVDALGGVAPALVREGVPAVIGMTQPVADDRATVFAGTLYRHLARGEALDTAVVEARLSIRGSDDPDWSLPALYSHRPDARIFDPPSEPRRTPEIARALARGRELLGDGRAREARADLAEARRRAPDDDEVDLCHCVAVLSTRPASHLTGSEAEHLDRRLGRLSRSLDRRIAASAAAIHALLRHDHHQPRALRGLGLSHDEVFEAADRLGRLAEHRLFDGLSASATARRRFLTATRRHEA